MTRRERPRLAQSSQAHDGARGRSFLKASSAVPESETTETRYCRTCGVELTEDDNLDLELCQECEYLELQDEDLDDMDQMTEGEELW